MKHVMKSLKHNGIYVPLYDHKGFSVKIQGQTVKLTPKTEPMAMAWRRRSFINNHTSPRQVFNKNFMKEFLEQLKEENPSASFLEHLYLQNTLPASMIHQQPKTTVDKLKKLILPKLKVSSLTKKPKKKP